MKWLYDPDMKTYSRMDDEGKCWGKIKGSSLPNPDFLLSKRAKLFPHASESEYRPTEVTYALWKHWDAQQEIYN